MGLDSSASQRSAIPQPGFGLGFSFLLSKVGFRMVRNCVRLAWALLASSTKKLAARALVAVGRLRVLKSGQRWLKPRLCRSSHTCRLRHTIYSCGHLLRSSKGFCHSDYSMRFSLLSTLCRNSCSLCVSFLSNLQSRAHGG